MINKNIIAPVSKEAMAIEIIFNQIKEESIDKLEEILVSYKDYARRGPLTEEEKEFVRIRVRQRYEYEKASAYSEVEDPALIVSPEDHIDWYEDWKKSNINRYYWDRFKNFVGYKLQHDNGSKKAGEIIYSIDNASDVILNRLENPQRINYQTKGLVIGYVQSGKTANFTAVIAKAVDTGYKFIIVLTGIHNNLRSQTQQRLDCELTGEPDVRDLEHVDIPFPEFRQWVRMTNYDHDFDEMNLSELNVYAQYRRPMLAIMKKNCPVLRRFIQWINSSSEEARASIPLLLIDDEADQASIDTNYSKDTDPSSTNALIREILQYFPRHAYIGYTATPFANVLVDLATKHDKLGRDLYPRNFIVSLPKPEGYFGSQHIFGHGQQDIFVRLVPDIEITELVPSKITDAHKIPVKITENLEKAILSFCLSCAVRYYRNDSNRPMTMLIHTTKWRNSHTKMKKLVEGYCRSLKARWLDPYERDDVKKQFKKIWEEDFIANIMKLDYLYPGLYENRLCNFGDIEANLTTFLNQLQILELNSTAEDKLDYTKNKDIKVIAIGGNSLSRGLTLEGLVTSFYLRQSNQYDTLLQMGRWFGYRKNYEDLTRVYTSKRLASWFEDLALVEQELRDELNKYEDENLTPADVSVRIRSHRTMKVTAKNKMGRAQTSQVSYSGGLCQTIWFLLDQPDILEYNLLCGEQFIISLKKFEKINESYLKRNVASDEILKFLESYKFAKKDQVSGPSLDDGSMLAYIKRSISRNELRFWNVAVIGHEAPAPINIKKVSWGGLEIIPVQRSRVAGTKYKIGVLSSPSNLVIDLPKEDRDLSNENNSPNKRSNPLLLLYRISKDSKPRKNIRNNKKGKPIELFEGIDNKVDVLGLVIVLPVSKTEPYDYIAQQDGRERRTRCK